MSDTDLETCCFHISGSSKDPYEDEPCKPCIWYFSTRRPVSQRCQTDADQRIREAVEAERERCIRHIYGQCGSDNVAERTVQAIRKGGDA